MLDDLEVFFRLSTTFHRGDALTKKVILKKNLPALAARTASQRLKNAVSNFIQENSSESRSTGT